MADNLVIVESPAKAKTIEKFLGKDFLVTSSYGHIRDLSKKDFGIDVKNGFAPNYIVPEDKKNVVAQLKKLTKSVKAVWLASDEDREGEAIAWHLCEVLELDPKSTHRIVFHEITKDAILKAIKKPRFIDQNLVNAQQARRILDRIVGFELSPVLWKKVKPSLSAGRVQSVAVRILVEREREIIAFKSTSAFRVTAQFIVNGPKQSELLAELQNRFPDKKQALDFLTKCKSQQFVISDITKRPYKKTPAAPFTTSTLQQEASRKLGFSVSQTMTLAQKLYEAGKITYMRTDSVNLSETALSAAEKIIKKEYGAEYIHTRQFKTKTKGAQEAHEAIRPTYVDDVDIAAGSSGEKKLYDLIWKRTLASQMKDAELEKTTVTIDISGMHEKFTAVGEVLIFDGFLKAYIESTDEDSEEPSSKMLPPLKIKELLEPRQILATEKFSHHPARYTEASLVRKLEELGIGRPSTYAPIISTIQQRGYVVKDERQGTERAYWQLILEGNKLIENQKIEITGAEKGKLTPLDIGMVVNDFLTENFEEVLNLNFTASVEKEFDDIAEGKKNWSTMLKTFYKPFHNQVELTLKNSERSKGKRDLGVDPTTGLNVYVLIGRYGPMVQLGEVEGDNKPRYASLLKTQYLETITFEEALKLFRLPRKLGVFEDQEIVVSIGKFGPYARLGSLFVSLKKDVDDPYSVTLERAIELIEEKRLADKLKVIKSFPEDETLRVLNGRWGAYIALAKANYRIPKDSKPEMLTYEDCMTIIKNAPEKFAKKSSKTAEKKTTTSAKKAVKTTKTGKSSANVTSKTASTSKTKKITKTTSKPIAKKTLKPSKKITTKKSVKTSSKTPKK